MAEEKKEVDPFGVSALITDYRKCPKCRWGLMQLSQEDGIQYLRCLDCGYKRQVDPFDKS